MRTVSAAAAALAAFLLALPGRMAAQQVNEFPIGNTALPLDIVAGPDGNFWFAEMVHRIGRMTPAGVVTEFPIPTASAGPESIVAGPDGALWFTESGGNKIGRITTAGDFTEFPVPTANSQPNGITLGPDGALWFTENQGNKIGRITTAGVITNEF